MNQVDVFGNELPKIISWGGKEWKPLIHRQVEIPYYFVSQDGNILCMRTGRNYKPKILNRNNTRERHEYSYISKITGKKCSYKAALSFSIVFDASIFPNYDYQMLRAVNVREGTKAYGTKYTSKKNAQLSIKVHRAVMQTWRPLDEFPPMPKEDWDKTPESVKQFVRNSVIVDHIDGDTLNNHVSNLRWCDVLQNNWQRKKKELIQ